MPLPPVPREIHDHILSYLYPQDLYCLHFVDRSLYISMVFYVMKEITRSLKNRNDSVQLIFDNGDNPEDLDKSNIRDGKANIETDTK